MPYKNKYFTVTRLVVLPDYQGIGIAKNLLTATAQHIYNRTKLNVRIVSSNQQLITLTSNKNWILKRKGHVSDTSKFRRVKHFKSSSSTNRLTMSFLFKPKLVKTG